MVTHARLRSQRAATNAIPAFFLYGEPVREAHDPTIHIETIAARSVQHAWHIRPHRHHTLYQVLLVQRGSASVTLDTEASSLAAPAAILVSPGCVHAFEFERDTLGYVVSFDSGSWRRVGATLGSLGEHLARPRVVTLDADALRATDLEALAAMLLRELTRSAYERAGALRGLLVALLANLLRLIKTAPHTGATGVSRDSELVARYRQLIDAHFREGLELASYAARLGVSTARLRRACAAVAGQSPLHLLHERMITEAVRQLRYTSASVTEIALFLGFEDPAYFTRFFVKWIGKSPRAYRNG